jgi:lysophospholipase L1-like esterase
MIGVGLTLPASCFAVRYFGQSLEQSRAPGLEGDLPVSPSFRESNRRLMAAGSRPDIVFIGDSITEGWLSARPSFWTPGRINRGIKGQTTSQLLLRLIPDVIDLRPRAVHIMAGTNDIAANMEGSADTIFDNLRAMLAIGQQSRVRILLGSIPPARAIPWRDGLNPSERIRTVNQGLRTLAEQAGATWVDYHSALTDRTGGMRRGLSFDEVHPTGAAYDIMAEVVEPLL